MKQVYQYLLLIFVILILTACGGTKSKPDASAQVHFQEGERYFEKRLYKDAIASWEKVRDTFYSPELSMLAEIKIAEAYFVSEYYEDAATAYSDFLTNHPNEPRAATMLYRLGLCYYHQILPANRDQTNTENALATFQQLMQRFPSNQYSQKAKNLIQRCKTRITEHDVIVSSFYIKKKNYQPAINRLEKILKEFPDYYYRDEAFFYLGKAYLKTDQLEKAQTIYQQLFEQFPGSDYTNDAKELLEDMK